MNRSVNIAIVGDYDAGVPAHRAIPRALTLAGEAAGVIVKHEWVSTETITSAARVSACDGLWCAPASPYRSMEGALQAIRFARQEGRPFLGTCGGFQHAIIEYARDVLGWMDAGHAETAPLAGRLVITPLSCALVEATGKIFFSPGSRVAAAYGVREAVEGYHCRFGLNPTIREALAAGPLRVSAEDEAGEVRAVELTGHPFFVATLFQPERAALENQLPPLAAAFIASTTTLTQKPASQKSSTDQS
ncbi:MAG TPA: CTP synthase [Candidatus Acidoferrales bacterium]|nr:CTP synthase [Candidatus Acidoferrales bacterium]